MSEARLVYLIRHGQTKWNVEKRLQGGKDSPLTDLGRQQAMALAASLKDAPPGLLLSSPLGRARQTAEAIANAYDVPFREESRLAELRAGAAEGLTLADIDARWPDLRAGRERDKWRVPWPDGESYRDVDDRLVSFVAEELEPLLQARDMAPLGIVGHETMNMILLGRMLGLDPPVVMRLGQPNHVIYRIRGRSVEHAHLGDDHLEWSAGALQKRSEEIIPIEAMSRI